MSRAKTTAQWRREVPAYDRACKAVQKLRTANGGHGHGPRTIAHLDPDTRTVSIILDGSADDCTAADRVLPYAAGGWRWDTSTPRPVWRKRVAS